MAEVVRVLELYSGIGGMHCALKASSLMHKVIAAYDVNTNANKIYQHNFPETSVIDKGIEGLTVKTYDAMNIDMILMSPPCQPFTRVGRKQDTKDARTNSFLHILDLLPRISRPPSYLLVENVKGFETSQARDRLINTLRQCQYRFQEFLLTPLQFGIPNSRLRYFLIAKKSPLKFGFTTSSEVLCSLPSCASDWLLYKKQAETATESLSTSGETQHGQCQCGGYLGKIGRTSGGKLDTCSLGGKELLLDVKSEDGNSVLNNESGDEASVAKRRKTECCVGDTEGSQDRELSGTVGDSTAQESLDRQTTCTKGDSTAQESQDRQLTCTEGDSTAKGADKGHSSNVCLEHYGSNMRQTHENQPDFGPVLKLKHFLEYVDEDGKDGTCDNLLSDKDLRRYMVMDIVNPCSTKTNCFTKRYGRYMEGAGSIVQGTKDAQAVLEASAFKAVAVEKQNSQGWGEAQINVIRRLRLRYFTPREIANLMGFPEQFGFPDSLTTRQLYMALGNSLNVHVVSVLIQLMTFNDFNKS